MTSPAIPTLFTVEHARALLTMLATLDTRFAQTDESMAGLRASAWAKVLSEVDPQFAIRHAQLAYSVPRDFMLQVGEIRQAWADHRARLREEELRRAEADEPVLIGNTSMIGYLRDVLDATREGRSVESVAKPLSLQTISPQAEERARRCVYWDLCSCDHTVCRAGWLDEEVEITNGQGKRYMAVVPCPRCRDGLLMAEETGRAKKPATAGRRR